MPRSWFRQLCSTRYTTKTMLQAATAIALLLGVWFGPRKYVARVYIGYSGFPVTGIPHPRFLKYRDDFLSDGELQEAEQGWILSPEVVRGAVDLLAAEGVNPQEFGSDPVEWFRQRVVMTPSTSPSHMELTLSHRESGYRGMKNHRRDTLAWKSVVALMKSYQVNSFSSPKFDANGDGLRLPTCGFHYIESRLW